MVRAEDVIRIYKLLSRNGIPVWLTGGWGIDALLGGQTRSHKDLDVIMLLDDVLRLNELLESEGYSLKEIWSENRWVLDADENKIATAFVLRDSEGREFDAHAMRLDDQGNGMPAWDEAEDFIFKKQDLAGMGLIAGFAVQCISPESQMVCHTGYELPEKHLRDMMQLRDKFGLEMPKNFRYGKETRYMIEKNLPTLESVLPELTDFVDMLRHAVDLGVVDNWERFSEKTLEFYTPVRMQKIDSYIPGWRKMAAYSDGATLVHVTSALVALKQLPEYHRATPIDQIICEWIVLLHDIDKEIHLGKRDHCHGFRSAIVASKILPGVGFTVMDDDQRRIEEWAERTKIAIKPGVDGKNDVQDNQKLPEILSGIDRTFGENSAAAIIVKTILLHFSINTCSEWPQVAPLSDAEIMLYIDGKFVLYLEIMMLVDSDAWALFDHEIKAKQRQESLFVFRNVRKLVKTE